MGSNFNKLKVQIVITLAIIAVVVTIALTVNYIKNNVISNKIRDNIEQGSTNLTLGKADEAKKITVKPEPIAKSKQIGYISKVYEEGGKRYLRFDDVKFLTGSAAVEEAKKNGDAGYEDGKYFVYNDYYIVNSTKEINSYVIANNASLNVLGCWIDWFSSDINNHPVSYDKFKSVSSNNGYMLCYIYTENNIVIKVEGQYTP